MLFATNIHILLTALFICPTSMLLFELSDGGCRAEIKEQRVKTRCSQHRLFRHAPSLRGMAGDGEVDDAKARLGMGKPSFSFVSDAAATDLSCLLP